MAARFQVKRTDGGSYQFVLLGANGRVLATSEPYRSKSACLGGLEAARKAAATARVEDQASPAGRGRREPDAPLAKAARVTGRAAGKAKAKAEEVLGSPSAGSARRRPARGAAGRDGTARAATATGAAPAARARATKRAAPVTGATPAGRAAKRAAPATGGRAAAARSGRRSR